MSKNLGKIVSINGNMIGVEFENDIIQNEVGYDVTSFDQEYVNEN